MTESSDVKMTEQSTAHTYCISILSQSTFDNLWYSDSDKVNSDDEIQYYENDDDNHKQRDTCNIYNEESELVEISWSEQTMINSERDNVIASITTSAAVMTAEDNDNNDQSEPLKMIKMSSHIVCDKMSRCIAWLKINEHNMKNFSVDKMMQITDEDIKNTDQILINLFWRVNKKKEEWSYTDTEGVECE